MLKIYISFSLVILCCCNLMGHLDGKEDLFSRSENEKLEDADTLQNNIQKKEFIDSLKNDFYKAEAYTHFAEQEESKGNLSDAEKFYREALAIRKVVGPQEEIGRGFFRLGYILLLQNKQKEAIEQFSESEAIFKSNSSFIRLNTVYTTMGRAYYEMGNYDEALEKLGEGFDLAQRYKYKYGQASALLNMTELYIKMEFFDQAISKGKECISIFEDLDNHEGAGTASMNIGSAYFYKGESLEAKDYYEKALNYENISEELKSKIFYNISTIDLEQENYKEALAIYLLLIKHGSYIKNKEFLATAYLNIGNIYYRNNQYFEAQEYFITAKEIATEVNNLEVRSEAMLRLVNNYYFLNQPEKALGHLAEWAKEEEKKGTKVANTINLIFEELKSEKSNVQRNIIIALLAIIIAIIGIFAAYLQRNKRKKAEREKETLEQRIDVIMEKAELKARLKGVDEERSRISEDLHDNVGMMLTATKLHFESLNKRLNDLEDKNRTRFDKALELLDQTHEETRRIVHNMANLTLTRNGLIAQLDEMVNIIREAKMLNISITADGINESDRWDPFLEKNIYRIIQELTSNTLKYAKASNLDIQIQKIEEELSLSIIDDGKGFDSSISSTGIGLNTVKDRVRNIGGNLKINSLPGKGTVVSIKNINLN